MKLKDLEINQQFKALNWQTHTKVHITFLDFKRLLGNLSNLLKDDTIQEIYDQITLILNPQSGFVGVVSGNIDVIPQELTTLAKDVPFNQKFILNEQVYLRLFSTTIHNIVKAADQNLNIHHIEPNQQVTLLIN